MNEVGLATEEMMDGYSERVINGLDKKNNAAHRRCKAAP
jgi:hypothetical protein